MTHRYIWIPGTEGTAEQLNFGAYWKAFTLEDMADIPEDDFSLYAAQAPIICHVADKGPYMWQSGHSRIADGESVVDSTDGQWVAQSADPSSAPYGVEAALGPLLQLVEQQGKQIAALQAALKTTPERYAIEHDVELGAVAATSYVDFPILLPVPELLPYLRDTDSILVTLKNALPVGLLFGGAWILGGTADQLEIRIYNYTGGSLTPGYTPMIISVERGRV